MDFARPVDAAALTPVLAQVLADASRLAAAGPDDPATTRRALQERSGAAGLVSARLAPSLGGRGLSLLGAATLVAEAAAVPGVGVRMVHDVALPTSPTAPRPLLLAARPIVRAHWLPRLLEGSVAMGVALETRAVATDAPSLVAQRRADGWRLSGTVGDVAGADDAGLLVVLARREAETRHTAFLVPRDRYRTTPTSPDLDGRPREVVHLADVDVPADHVLGAVDDGDVLAREEVATRLLHVAARALGALDRDGTSPSDPVVAAARLLLWEAAWRVDADTSGAAPAASDQHASRLAVERVGDAADLVVRRVFARRDADLDDHVDDLASVDDASTRTRAAWLAARADRVQVAGLRRAADRHRSAP